MALEGERGKIGWNGKGMKEGEEEKSLGGGWTYLKGYSHQKGYTQF